MSIYFGSNKIGKIYVGDTSIGKVYHGSELVYQKAAGLKLYCYYDNNVSAGQNMYTKFYVIGGQTTNNPWMLFFTSSNYSELGTAVITTITGNLGASGSKIKINNETQEYTYVSSTIINNITIFLYGYTSSSWGLTSSTNIYVMQNSTLNSVVLKEDMKNGDITYPASIDDTQFKLWPSSNNYAYGYRYSTGDKTWTINGLV
ncbi:MAG: hypothetical protein IJ677_05275 [Alphaproteobacteria bacterium]|nr:hypothetical protein [Alphaproteobacteria bacterium]